MFIHINTSEQTTPLNVVFFPFFFSSSHFHEMSSVLFSGILVLSGAMQQFPIDNYHIFKVKNRISRVNIAQITSTILVNFRLILIVPPEKVYIIKTKCLTWKELAFYWLIKMMWQFSARLRINFSYLNVRTQISMDGDKYSKELIALTLVF